MRKMYLIFAGLLLVSCTIEARDYPVIRDPGYPWIVVREKETLAKEEKSPLTKPEEEPLAKPEESSSLIEKDRTTGIFYPDPTRILIENRTYNIFVKVWLAPSFEKGRVKGKPDFDLPPNVKVEAILPLGNHVIYAEGRVKTAAYGWQSVGTVSKEFYIGSRVYYWGDYGAYVVFRQYDFPRY